MNRITKDKLFIYCTKLIIGISLVIVFSILLFILYKGYKGLNSGFILTESKSFGAEGGILYQIIGSLMLTIMAGIICFPIALGAAIYDSEYLKNPKIKSITSTLIFGLNGVPSIIFGIFGLIFFVNILGTGISWLVGSVILAFMILPTALTASRQTMESIPKKYREASLGLGLTKWQMIRSVIIPQSFSGSLTGLFIGLARAIGETAPIMFIATAFSGVTIPYNFLQPAVTLPTHLLNLAQNAVNPSALQNAWSTALVLIFLVVVFNLTAMILRFKFKTYTPQR